MGIIKSGIQGPVRNKIGDAVARRHRNTNVISAKNRKSNKPPTAKQLVEQSKFGQLSNFLSTIEILVIPGYKKYAKGKTSLNAAFTYNYPHAFVKEGEDLKLDFPEIKYSRGRITTPEEPEVIVTEDHITFSWLPQPQYACCQFTDLASFLVYNPADRTSLQFVDIVDRYTGEFKIEIPANNLKGTFHCYMSFASANGKLAGDSIYVGQVLLDSGI